MSAAADTEDGETFCELEGRVVRLSCDLDGDPAPHGRGYVVVEMALADVRRSPICATVTVVVPDRATYMGQRVAELMREGES